MFSNATFSPLRYPGGKAWLAPQVAEWAVSCGATTIIEPFAGGASVALYCVISSAVERAVIAEKDAGIHNLWNVILNYSDADFRLLLFGIGMMHRPTHAADDMLKSMREWPGVVNAVRTIAMNRGSFGGILRPGAGRMGEELMHARWNPSTIIRRLRAIRAVRHRIVLREDAFQVMEEWKGDPAAFLFLDPPYSHASNVGASLYTHHTVDHERLMTLFASGRAPGVCTYNDAVETRDLAARHGLYHESIGMQDNLNRRRTELLISKSAG